jgi:ER membrane protein complex subunit 6
MLIVSALIFVVRAEGKPSEYFHRPLGDLWGGEVFNALSSFVLTWTLFYGLVRA